MWSELYFMIVLFFFFLLFGQERLFGGEMASGIHLDD
jgi:hypothetical protein